MVRGKLKAVLALLIVMTFILQAAPIYTFANNETEQSITLADNNVDDKADESAANENETQLNYVIDENGNKAELTDEMREAIDNEESNSNSKLDIESFYQYDEDEVSLAGDQVVKLNETFDECNDGDTTVPGWILKSIPKLGSEASIIKVEKDSNVGNVLRMQKNLNGASYEKYDAGDEDLYAVYDFNEELDGNILISADMYVEVVGRMGLFFYGQCDDIETAISSSDPNIKVPYLGRAYLWDTGGKQEPAKNAPNGLIAWDNDSKDTDNKVPYSAGQWYNLSFDIDTETGMYTFVLKNSKGEELYSNDKLQLTSSVLSENKFIQGIGINIQKDEKSLGTAKIKNVKVIDNTVGQQNARAVTADKNALSLPLDLDAEKVESNFYLPLKGDNGTTIKWTSSDDSIVKIDNATGLATVTNPPYTGEITVPVVLTAVVSKGNTSSDKSFNIKVVEALPSSDKELVDSDKILLDLPSDIKASEISDNFVMPIVGTYGSTITYTSSDPNVISIDNTTGVVTINKPGFTGSDTQPYVLTATITKNKESATKDFNVRVKEQDPATDAEKALFDANNTLIGGIDITNVRQDSFFLSDKGKYADLSWSSSNESYLKIVKDYEQTDPDNENNGDEKPPVALDGFKAVVTRPERNENPVQVTLTVNANVNGSIQTNEFLLTIIPEDALKAFPGVEGYGAYAKGGRGGRVYHVTTLDHDGEGSLTYGLEKVQGARTIVFDVGGVIDLTSLGRPISIKGEKYSNVTIAGQTAPYPGITLKGYGLSVSSAHDVIIRNIKIRIGDVLADNELYQSDPLGIGGSRQVVVDHCTLHWAIDMGFRTTGEYVTISNSIIGKALYLNSPHEKGAHPYVGMINEGARKVTFAKNFVGDSNQRSPRITDADWIDSYNCLLYNCGNGYDLFNYEWQNKNAKMNVYNNYARMGPNFSNGTPYRMGRGREYSGGIMAYFTENYKETTKSGKQRFENLNQATNNGGVDKVLKFGYENSSYGEAYNLTNVTLDEWNNNPLSYDNQGKKKVAATMAYMQYPFPAPRGDIMDVFQDKITEDSKNNIINLAISDNGMGATRPARDLYDTMVLEEMLIGGEHKGKEESQMYSLKVNLSEDRVSPFFEELERRTGLDYSAFKTSRSWWVTPGPGPTLRGAEAGAGLTKPVNWNERTDVNVNTNPNATKTYHEKYITDFEIGDWWGQYCGSPGRQIVYTLFDNNLGRTVTTTDPDYDQTRYTLMTADEEYIAVERTVSDLYPADWVKNNHPEIAEFMDNYRKTYYAGKADSYKIAWDGMGDGIPNWYKQYRGWSTSRYLANEVNDETGYTYLEEFLQFMADDQPLDADDTPASIENFKVNNLGYSTAQVFWNTDYRTTCVIEYGKEPGKYTNSEVLAYDDTTDYFHTYHAQTLIDLEPDTNYYYKITAIDENSNTTVAEYNPNDDKQKNMTFKTTIAPEGSSELLPEKPTVTGVIPYLNQVRINWKGNVATDESYEIYYDTQKHDGFASYANKITGIDARNNKQVVTGLENGRTYYFVVVAVNKNGKTAADVISEIPTGTLIDFDFTTMTEAEKKDFMVNQYMYILGGSVTMQKDPDTGENCLQLLDETNSHGVNSDIKFALTQDDKFTYEVKMKILYQKQTDALNRQEKVKGDGSNERNTIQVNFYKDTLMNEDKDSTNSALWETAFSLFFDSESTAISESNGRFDGTVEEGTFKFASSRIGNYGLGKTPGKAEGVERVLPQGTGYKLSVYDQTTKYGDAVYSKIANTDKTLHGLWYYQKGSAAFVTYKVVVDPVANNVKVYADDKAIYEVGEFSEDMEEPFNIGKVQIKSRNDGYSWVNIASIKAYSGDGKSTIKPPTVPPGTIGGTGGGGGGNGGSNATPTPEPTLDPNVTPTPTPNTNTNKHFDDLGNYEWAVDSINALAEMNVINGTGDRVYSPQANVTRAEYVTMLMRAFGKDVASSTEVSFSDVNSSDWYFEAISKAISLNVVKGYEDGTFGVNGNISREDMMVMAYRAMSALNISIPKVKEYDTFADQSSISEYAVDAVNAMYCAEIINGVGDGLLDPLGNAERAQAAKIIYGLINMGGTVNE